MPLELAQHGSSASQAGLTVTLMLAATIAMQPLVPLLIRRHGTGLTQALGPVALCGATPLYSLHSLAVAYAAAIVRGAGFAVLTVAGVLLATTVVDPEHRSRSVAVYGVATTLPNPIVCPLGVALTSSGHFAWMAWASLTTLLTVPIAFRLDSATPSEHVKSEILDIGRRRALRDALPSSLVVLTAALAGGGLTTYLPILRPSGPTTTIALSLFGLGLVVGRWQIHRVVGRAGRQRRLPLICTIAGLAVTVIGLAAPRGAGAFEVLVEISSAVFGLGCGAIQHLTMLRMMSQTSARSLAAVSAMWNIAVDLGTGLGALLVGGTANTGVGVAGGITASGALLLAAAPVAAFSGRGPRWSHNDQQIQT